MSLAGPDRDEYGDRLGPKEKPLCTTRPSASTPEDWETCALYLRDRNLNHKVAWENGWYSSRTAGDEELRIVIPCLSADLTNRYWQGRLARTADPKNRFPLRYTSPHHVRRGDALAVVNPTISCAGTALVEGPMDALAAADIGLLGIAWMGTDPGHDPIDFAQRLIVKKKPVFIISDKDAVAAAVRIWSNFVGAFLINPYPFKDLAEMSAGERREYLKRV